jgi:hypothetical protein
MQSSPWHRSRRFARIARTVRVNGLALVGLVVLVLVAAACSIGSAGADTGTSLTESPTATTSLAEDTPTGESPTATTVHPTPTPTHHPATATPTPAPVLHATVVTKAFNSNGPISGGSGSGIIDVTCPSGYLVAGGGISSGYTNFTVMVNAPISTTTWRGEVWNDSASAMYAQMQVVCLKASGLQSQIKVAGLGNVDPSNNSTITDVTCPSGYLVAGGGVSSGYEPFTTMTNAPVSTTKWEAEIYNTGSGAITGQVQVVCLKASGLHAQYLAKSLGTINANTNSTILTATCPSGYLVAGGGVSSGYTNFTTMDSRPVSTTKWEGEIFNHAGSAIFGQVQVVCMKLG